MEISNLEFEILMYINEVSHSNDMKGVKTEALKNKFGTSCIYALCELRDKDYLITKFAVNSNESIAVIQYEDDNWKLTDKGACFLTDHKITESIAKKEKQKSYFWGFISGIVSESILQLIAKLLQ